MGNTPEPVELLERGAAMIPRPSIKLVLYHGVLAPRGGRGSCRPDSLRGDRVDPAPLCEVYDSAAQEQEMSNPSGTTFGAGDGVTTFQVPDLRGRFTLGVDPMAGGAGGRLTDGAAAITGGVGGAASHTLTADELPHHSHHYSSASVLLTNGRYPSYDSSDISQAEAFDAETAAVGGGRPHSNMPPFVAVRYIICVGVATPIV